MRNLRAGRLSLPRAHRPIYGPFAKHTVEEGRWPLFETEGRETIVVHNPATEEELCEVVTASPSDVQTAIQDAHDVYKSGEWSKAPALARSEVLSNLAVGLRERLPEWVKLESQQTGRTIREMTAQLGRLPEWLEYYAALLRTHSAFVAPTQGKLLNYVERVPLGVVAQITPFNHPLLIAIKKIAPALAAGNSVIVKPSELTPMTVLEFAELAADAGVPLGVLSVLPGYGKTTGMEIVSNPLIKKIDFTGGNVAGVELGRIAGGNLASFTGELGGKAPIVVFDDADLVSSVNGAAFAAFVASGQTCVSGTRIVIQDKIYDEFMSLFLKKVESITNRMGSPMNPSSTMGSIISPKQLERIENMVQRKRKGKGTILIGGQRMTGKSSLDDFDFSRGSFFAPTVIQDVDTSDELWREEIFGPVVVVTRFSEEQEGIDLANACKYGLGAGIWTQDLSRAHRVAKEIEAGLVWVNTHHRNDPSSPWGGMKQSGVGRENGVEAYEAYSQSKSTIINIASAEETRSVQDWFAEEEENAATRYG